MSQALTELALFASKSLIVLAIILFILIAFFMLIAKGKGKMQGYLSIKNLNKKQDETKEELLSEMLPKKAFKKFLKDKKQKEKTKSEDISNVFVLNFHGDIKASAVAGLREEVSAILNIAKPQDEVILKLESAGGIVHGYGLAAAQLHRLKQKHILLTICIDKMAASGGYMMACTGDRILAAPFSIIGSIGVIVQLPNFHRVLKDKHIDFEQLTAGDYKRTLTVFGENTAAGREKLQEEIEEIHQRFKNLIATNRPRLDIDKVATGEHWLGEQALELNLVDELKTSDEYIMHRIDHANVYEIHYEMKKSFLSKLTGAGASLRDSLLKIFVKPVIE